MRYAMVLLGMTEKDLLNKLEEDVILEFIRAEYGIRFTSEDFRLAFRWAMSGKTDVDKSFYGKRFSVAYLSNFMEAYEVKKKEMLELEKRNRKPEMKLIEDTRTPEQKLKDRFDIFEKYVIENKKLPHTIDTIPCFNYLESIGKLDLSKETIEKLQLEAEIEMEREREIAKLKGDRIKVREMLTSMNDLTEIDLRTKRKFVEGYFKNLIASVTPL